MHEGGGGAQEVDAQIRIYNPIDAEIDILCILR